MSSIDIREEAGVRTLHFGSDWIQGAMRIARPWQLELDYTQDMMASLLFREDGHFPNQALLIGLGAASLTKFLYRHRPETKLTVVEIDPAVVAAACHFFKLPEDQDRLRIIIDDGVHFMHKTERTYDLILVDGFDANAKAGELDNQSFYQRCRECLTRDGIVVVNLIGRSHGFIKSIERLKAAFDGRALSFPACESGNIIAFASGLESVDIHLSALREQAQQLKKSSGLNLLPLISRLEKSKSCPSGRLII